MKEAVEEIKRNGKRKMKVEEVQEIVERHGGAAEYKGELFRAEVSVHFHAAG